MQQKDILALVILLLSINLLLRPLFSQPGFPITIDGEGHLARFANYKLALEAGQVPPRIGSSFNYGFTYPIFNFYYHLPYILSYFFHPLVGSYTNTFKLLIAFSLFSGGLSFYAFFRKQNFVAAIMAALVYISAPYQLLNIFDRGALGEIVAMGILPWLFVFGPQLITTKQSKLWWAYLITTTALLLSHNITALFGSLFFASYMLFHYKKNAFNLLLPTLAALSLVAWFWVPALLEKHYTVLDQSTLQEAYSEFFRPASHLFRLDRFGQPSSLESQGLGEEVGYAGLAGLLLAGICLGYSRSKTKLLWFWVASFCGALYLTNQASAWIWAGFPFIEYVQFPSRFLIFTTLAIGFMTGYLSFKQTKFAILIGFGALFNLFFFTPPQHFIPYADKTLAVFPLTGTAENEYDPIWYQHQKAQFTEDISPETPVFQIIPEVATVSAQLIEANGSKRVYQLTVEAPVTIVENTLYFPGWETKIDNQIVDIDATKYDHLGLINYQLQPGIHTVTTRFTQKTPSRILGTTITSIGLGLLLIKTIRDFMSLHRASSQT